jgi:hypothetical protein
VVDGLETSFVAAVTRMVLVGRGGLRLHEEVFLAGVRLGGRGAREMAEDKAEAALETALDGDSLTLASAAIRGRLADMWNATDAPLPQQLRRAMDSRAKRRHRLVAQQLADRQRDDTRRATGIFDRFRANLRDSLAALERDEEAVKGQLFADPDQLRQWRRDRDAMAARLADLDDEEAREIDTIRSRYAEVKPHTTAAAVVFALTRADAEGWTN